MSENEKFVEWRRDWSPDEEAEIQAAVRLLRTEVSLMRALREVLGLSQIQLSEILETSQSNVSKMEAKAEPNLAALRRLIEHQGGRLTLVAELRGRHLELPL